LEGVAAVDRTKVATNSCFGAMLWFPPPIVELRYGLSFRKQSELATLSAAVSR
jgi:hypothetical protein